MTNHVQSVILTQTAGTPIPMWKVSVNTNQLIFTWWNFDWTADDGSVVAYTAVGDEVFTWQLVD